MQQPIPNTTETDAVRTRVGEKIKRVCGDRVERVLLISTPQVSLDQFIVELAKRKRYFCYPPYGLAKLTNRVLHRGYDARLVDLNYETLAGVTEDPDLPILDLWHRRLQEEISDYKPDIVGISLMFTMGYNNMNNLVDMVKRISPDMPVVLGGVHVTNAMETTLLDNDNIDFIATYENEEAFPDLLDFINGVKSIDAITQLGTVIDGKVSYISARNTPTAEDLNHFPTYLDLPVDRYNQVGEVGNYRFWVPKGAKISTVLTNRGCRARCSFCSVSNFNGKMVRARSVTSVVDEIEMLKNDYDISHISWLDDDLLYQKDRAIHLFNELVRRKVGITWDASNGVIASACRPEIVEAAAASGMIGMHVGVETGNEQILRDIHKPSGVKHFLKLGGIMHGYPQVFTRGYLIIGFPDETLNQMMDTIHLGYNMALDWYTISTLTPLPNTEIFDMMVENEQIDADTIDWSKNYYSPTHGKRKILEERQRFLAKDFVDYFDGDQDVVPTLDMMDDIWFLVDYKINYERVLSQNDPDRLMKLRAFLTDISDRMTTGNPLSNLFLGVVASKLGDGKEAKHRTDLCERYLEESVYWQKRFEVLDLHTLIRETKKTPDVTAA